ncbi:MAG: hypothetical protein ACRCXZ_00190 [Patescibacteria group bacterium]
MPLQVIQKTSGVGLRVLEKLDGINSGFIKDGSGSMGFNYDTPLYIEETHRSLFGGNKTSRQAMSREQAANELTIAYTEQVLKSDPKPDLCIFDDNFWYEMDCEVGSPKFDKYLSQRSHGEDYIIPALDRAFEVHMERKANPKEKSKTLIFVLLDGACADRNKLPEWIRRKASLLDSADEFHLVFTKIGRVDLDSFYKTLDNLDNVKFDIISFFSLDEIVEFGLENHLAEVLHLA